MTFTKLPTLIAASSLAFVAACAGGPNNNENTSGGALLGGTVGALVGAASGDSARERRQGALIGAALGAAGGAAIGNQLDRQEEELRQALGNNVGIVNNGDNLTVTLPQDILFATGSSALTGALQNDLVTVARSLNNNPNTIVSVIGHTDNVGEAAFNFDLSQRRAQAVTSVLINAGVSASRVRSIGRGEDQPIASNLTSQGRQQNRRVEIVISPN